jgi:peptide chain release factor
MKLKEGELKIECYRSSGPGGQRKNKKETAVRLTHMPTGISAVATESRSQAQNKRIALHRLQERLVLLRKKRRKRIRTSVPVGIREKMLEHKRLQSKKKEGRRKDAQFLFERYA